MLKNILAYVAAIGAMSVLLRAWPLRVAISFVVGAVLLAGPFVPNACGGQPDVSLVLLLDEMGDRNALPRLPKPTYSVHQASSHDRRQLTPDDPEGWFANQDYGNALRIEETAGRQEWVILEHDGPGCITRIWTPNADSGTVRFYLDGHDQPAIETNFQELVGGRALVGPPLALLAVRGDNLYLPIPFARSCKITLSKEPFYYAAQYRAYEPGTIVETFSDEVLAAAADAISCVGERLARSTPDAGATQASLKKTIPSGGSASLPLLQGPAAVTQLQVRIRESDAIDIEQALRSVVLAIDFDDEPTVWCPLGEFFGLGIARQPYSDWIRAVDADGTMTCRWVMPYKRAARVELVNLSEADVEAELSATTDAWQWDERSLHFHTNWRQQFPISGVHVDWNYLDAVGAGLYVGDTLTTMNPHWSWWGEGDEKVYVDGAATPALLGTGLEDYYGYAWGIPNFFASPFLSTSRVRYTPVESEHIGHTTVSRLRSLDAIPFARSLRLDMEVACIGKNEGMAWSVATFWYGRPGATAKPAPAPEEAARRLQYPPGLSRRHLREPLTQAELDRLIPGKKRLPGAIECEDMMQTTAPGVTAQRQHAYKYIPHGHFSGGDFLYVDARQAGDFVELKFAPRGDGLQTLTVYPTRGPGYGAIRFVVNGHDVPGTHDLTGQTVDVADPIELGTYDAPDGLVTLRVVAVEPVDKNRAGAAPFGLDCVVPTQPRAVPE